MSFPHIDYLTPSRHTLIKEDLLVSMMEVDSINESISALEKGTPNWTEVNSIPDKLNRISDVYNQNVDFITGKLKNFNFDRTSPDPLEGYQAVRNNPVELQQYALTQQARMMSCEEHAQYAQIARVCDHLKTKIETLNGRIDRYLSSHPTVRIPHIAVTALHKAPTEYSTPLQVRELGSSPMVQPLSGNNPITEVTTSTFQVLMIAALAAQINSRPVHATVKCEVGEGNVLGICSAPTWGDKPVAFAKTFQGEWSGWIGKAPTNVEFKFVIINSSGQVQQWEQGQNRKLSQNNGALILTANQVQF